MRAAFTLLNTLTRRSLRAAGHQAEAALEQAMRAHAGKYVCVVEGAIPTRENGIYCMIGGRTALEIVNDVAGQAVDYMIDEQVADELQRLGARIHFKPLWDEDLRQVARQLVA